MSDRALPRMSSQHSALLAKITQPRSRAPRVMGAFTYLVGFVDIATGVARGWRQRLHPVADLLPGAIAAASVATVVSGILLLLLAHALRRRKRRAWRAALVLLSLSVVLHAVKFEFVAVTISLAVLIALIAYRAEFRALGDPQTRWRAVRVFLVLAAASLAVGVLLVILLRRQVVGGTPGLGDTIHEVLTGLVGLEGPLSFRDPRVTDFEGAILLGLGLMTALTSTYLALRPPEPRPQLTEADEATMRSLLEHSERGERLGAGPFLRAWRSVVLFASRWFQIESLYRFNAKFRPTWVPRFVVYPATRDLPRIAVAALEAEAFLTWPHLHRFSGTRT